MSLLVRKIEKGKWLKREFVDRGEIPADAITLDLKTKSNALSVWEIESEEFVEDVVLAFVSGLNTVEAIDIMILDADFLRKEGIECIQVDGKTPYKNLRKNHRELVSISYRTLGIIAKQISEGFIKAKTVRFTERRLIDMLLDATTEDRKIPFDDLDNGIKDKIRRYLTPQSSNGSS